jgi:ribosomal protein S18 acetylase RimI-like enzyme
MNFMSQSCARPGGRSATGPSVRVDPAFFPSRGSAAENRGVTLGVRFGEAADVDAAVWVFERSNLARRRGVWPGRPGRVERVRSHLYDRASWFLVAAQGPVVVAMASARPLHGDDSAGAATQAGILSYLYVVPERWGEGIGGMMLDAALAEAARRQYARFNLWTHQDNERSQRLYRSRGFTPAGRTAHGEDEWVRLTVPVTTAPPTEDRRPF